MTEEPKSKYKELFSEPIPTPPMPDPLKDIGTIENVETETRTRLFKYYSKFQIYSYCVISTFWILYWAYAMIQKLQNGPSNTDLRGYFLAILVPFIFFGISYGNLRNKILRKFVEQFAQENGFNYLTASKQVTDEYGALFNLGHSKRLTHVIGGKLNNHDVKIFYYQYTIGQGKQAHTYFSTVLEINNDHIVPPILLVVDKQYFGGIKPTFTDSTKLKPEYNFDSEFDLYTKEKFEIEALQVFSQDVLEKMLRRWRVFNIDFSGNKIYIFTNKHITSRLVLQNMFALGKYALETIDPKLVRLQGSIINLLTLNPENK